jgi:hypothetical protein
MIENQNTDVYDDMYQQWEINVRNLMSQGFSREEAEAQTLSPDQAPTFEPEVYSEEFDGSSGNPVDDPHSSIFETTVITKDDRGGTVTTTSKNPTQTPDALAKKAAEELEEWQNANPANYPNTPAPGTDSSIYDGEWEDHSALATSLSDVVEAKEQEAASLEMPTTPVTTEEVNVTADADASVKVLAEEAPYELGVINDFADWAANRPEEESVKKATEIIERAKESGLDRVKPHVYKALGITLASMLFGADAATAATQGLGAVNKTFENERQVLSNAAAVQAEQEKFKFEETTKADQKIRAKAAENILAAPANEQARILAIQDNNQKMITTLSADIDRSLSEQEKENWGVRSVRGEVARAVAKMESTYKGYDLTKSINQGVFSSAIENWITSPGRKTPLFTFIEDQIARNKLTSTGGFAAEDFVQGSMPVEDYHSANKKIFEKMKRVAGKKLSDGLPAGEDGAGRLMREAYESFKTNNTDAFVELSREAGEAGMSPIMFFLTEKYIPK